MVNDNILIVAYATCYNILLLERVYENILQSDPNFIHF